MSIEKMQIENIEIIKDIHPTLSKLDGLSVTSKLEVCKQNFMDIMQYVPIVVKAIYCFQYEEFYGKAEHLAQCAKELSSGEEVQGDNLFKMLQVISDLSLITGRLIDEYNYSPKQCNCCDSRVYYLPLSSYYEKNIEKHKGIQHIPETLNKKEYTCPHCGGSDRDRLITLMLKRFQLDQGYYQESLLQIAPSKAIEHWINRNCSALQYESTDLYMDNVTFRSDIQSMDNIKSDKYDYVICSHVLEHVQDDRLAMKELFRIIKKDGFCIFLVPIALDCDTIDEEWGLSEEENWRRFGQNDHCRIYAKEELKTRLRECGFYIHEVGMDFFGQDLFYENGITSKSILYILTKKNGDISELIDQKIQKRKEIHPPKPLVSVVMSAYNHEKYVGKTIESVLNQTYQTFEFLVADDHSTDRTVDEILKYENFVDEIHLFDENAYCRFDFLIEIARGKYIAVINSDDIWQKDKLERQVYYMENHPEVAACFTHGSFINENDDPLDYSFFSVENRRKEEWMHQFFYKGNCLAHPSILIRTEIYQEFLESGVKTFRQLPDFWMWVQLVQKREIHIIERELIKFRFHLYDNNPNTSTPSAENSLRHKREESYLWYDTIKKMERDYFIKVFHKEMIYKNITTEEELLIEKFFVLKSVGSSLEKCASLFFLYDICQKPKVISLLKEKYHFDFKDIHMMAVYE